MEQSKQSAKQKKRAVASPDALSEITPKQADRQKSGRPFSYWLQKNRYYHRRLITFYQFMVPKNSAVLVLNCKNGYLLDALQPAVGVGIDVDADCIAAAQTMYAKKGYQFVVGAVADLRHGQQFDYIVLPLVTMESDDIQAVFEQLKPFCHSGTRIIIESYSYLWAPLLWCMQKCGLRRPTRFKNWVSAYDVRNFLSLAGMQVVTSGQRMLLPLHIPILSWLCNKFLVHVPLVKQLCLHQWFVARPLPVAANPRDYTVSVIIPCRNEKGNIEAAVRDCPVMGKHTEYIFVEGHSTDGTLDEIKRVTAAYADKDISWYTQEGKGKGDAVRKAFSHATGDVLIILDSDLTVDPQEMPKFFTALVSGRGECINGSRLVYGMESGAMRLLNSLANFGFGIIVSWGMGQRVKDTLCGTKALWRSDYQKLAAQRTTFGLHDPFGDFDLLFGAAKLNRKIVDLPVRYKARTYGETKFSTFSCVGHGLQLLRMCLIGMSKFRFR